MRQEKVEYDPCLFDNSISVFIEMNEQVPAKRSTNDPQPLLWEDVCRKVESVKAAIATAKKEAVATQRSDTM